MAQEEPFITIEDQDIRCTHVFREGDQGRCWIIAAKIIKFEGREVGRYCQFHLEAGLMELNKVISRAMERRKNGNSVGGD